MARHVAVVTALCALVAGITAGSAVAHGGSKDYESLVRGVTPPIPGFAVAVLNGDDRLEARNTGTTSVTIEGYSKEPYIRMSADGKVEVNLRSPAYYLNQDRFYGAAVPDSAKPNLAPQWKVVERTGRYEFHDHRMHYMAKNVPSQVTDEARRTKVFDWNVPLRARGTTGQISGQLFWRGADSGPPLGAFAGLGTIVLVGGASVVLVRRRRRAASGDTGASGLSTPRGEAW